jgi:hypothetical protein
LLLPGFSQVSTPLHYLRLLRTAWYKGRGTDFTIPRDLHHTQKSILKSVWILLPFKPLKETRQKWPPLAAAGAFQHSPRPRPALRLSSHKKLAYFAYIGGLGELLPSPEAESTEKKQCSESTEVMPDSIESGSGKHRECVLRNGDTCHLPIRLLLRPLEGFNPLGQSILFQASYL